MGILDGHVAIVTGAGQGSGRGVALALAAEGASVAVVGRTESKLVDVAQEIKDRGGIAIPLRCDVGDTSQIDAVVKATADRVRADRHSCPSRSPQLTRGISTRNVRRGH